MAIFTIINITNYFKLIIKKEQMKFIIMKQYFLIINFKFTTITKFSYFIINYFIITIIRLIIIFFLKLTYYSITKNCQQTINYQYSIMDFNLINFTQNFGFRDQEIQKYFKNF